MSIDIVKQCLESFLASDQAEVLAIRGHWGVGKTYFWNKTLSYLSTKRGAIAWNKYSYVSLFGINSLEAFKFSVFEHIIDHSLIGQESNLKTFSKNVDGVTKSLGRKSIGAVFGIEQLKGFSLAMESVAWLSVRNCLICIDDLERKGEGLSLKDTLGLISYLKENRGCKFVLILNDNEENVVDYKKYREKVVDVELIFAPSPEECAEVAIPADTPALSLQRKFSVSLGISNIRTIHKTKRLVLQAEEFLKDFDEEILRIAVSSIALYSYCFYRADNKSIPTLEYIVNIGTSLYGFGNEEELSNQHKSWNRFLQNYEYTHTDELDQILAEGVVSGYFDGAKLRQIAKIKNEEILLSKSRNEFSNAWGLYHNTFASNEQELIEEMSKSLKENAKSISPTNLNSTVVLFKELGYAELASELIDFYIEARKDQPDVFNISRNPFSGSVTDAEIRQRFAEIELGNFSKPTLKDVLHKLSTSSGWSRIDVQVLAETSADEYFDFFMTEESVYLYNYINAALQFKDFSNADDKHKIIVSNVESALRRIANSSQLNKHRAGKFGVTLNSQDIQ